MIQEAGVLQPLEMMSDELNKETIRQIFHDDLRKNRICPEFVPHRLTGRRNGDSHHAEPSSGLVQTIQIFLVAL
jgi:hypothetical protein